MAYLTGTDWVTLMRRCIMYEICALARCLWHDQTFLISKCRCDRVYSSAELMNVDLRALSSRKCSRSDCRYRTSLPSFTKTGPVPSSRQRCNVRDETGEFTPPIYLAAASSSERVFWVFIVFYKYKPSNYGNRSKAKASFERLIESNLKNLIRWMINAHYPRRGRLINT